jgi:CheY-like chemotaxis protein
MLAGKRALVIAESGAGALALGDMLVSAGVEFDTAATGKEGLRRLKEREFDVAIFDCRLTDMDGLTLLEAARRAPNRAALPVLMLSSAGAVGGPLNAFAALGAGTIQEPVGREELHAALGRLFASAAPVSASSPEGGESVAQSVTESQVSGADRVRLLLVEDNEVNRMVVKMMLAGEGFEIVEAIDGMAGLAELRSTKYDIVLMDISMPVMDGLEATRTFRSQEANTGARRTPIVGLTAHATPQDADYCLSAGMDDHLTKPVRKDTLLFTIKQCLAAEAGRGRVA